jgi:hypothetical protein
VTNDFFKAGLLVLSLVFLLGMGQAQQEPDRESRGKTDATLTSKEAPSAEFLEFLATFNTGNNRFADPALLEALASRTSRGTQHE